MPDPLIWIDVEDRLPTRDDLVVLVWAETTPEDRVILRPLLEATCGHVCVAMAHYVTAWPDLFLGRVFEHPPARRWLLVPGDEPFKHGVVRRWAEFNPPSPEDRRKENA